MKLVSYKLKKEMDPWRIGCMVEDRILDLQGAYLKQIGGIGDSIIDADFPADPDTFYSFGEAMLEKARECLRYVQNARDSFEELLHERESAIIGAPVPNPSKIICVGKNYAEHAAEMDSDVPDHPVLFAKFTNALIGPEDPIEKSPATEKLDYEVELTIVIGKPASKVKRAEAYDYIAGYTIGNDTSARDLQKRTQQWLQGKTLDRTTPIGPWVVTADELVDPSNLSIRSFVNGEERQSSNTSKLIFDIPYLVEFISNLITLNPGDIIMTGTPDGVGFAMKPPQFLNDGDVVTLEIEGIGTMENKVVKP